MKIGVSVGFFYELTFQPTNTFRVQKVPLNFCFGFKVFRNETSVLPTTTASTARGSCMYHFKVTDISDSENQFSVCTGWIYSCLATERWLHRQPAWPHRAMSLLG